jgi:hypothetical protein
MRAWSDHASSFPDVVFILAAEEFDTTRHRAGRSVAQGAEDLARDIIADIQEKIDITQLAVPVLKPFQELR